MCLPDTQRCCSRVAQCRRHHSCRPSSPALCSHLSHQAEQRPLAGGSVVTSDVDHHVLGAGGGVRGRARATAGMQGTFTHHLEHCCRGCENSNPGPKQPKPPTHPPWCRRQTSQAAAPPRLRCCWSCKSAQTRRRQRPGCEGAHMQALDTQARGAWAAMHRQPNEQGRSRVPRCKHASFASQGLTIPTQVHLPLLRLPTQDPRGLQLTCA